MINKYYNLNFYEKYMEIEINYLPKNDFNKNKLFYDLILYYKLNDTIIRYKNKIINNKKELKLFFKSYTKSILQLYKFSKVCYLMTLYYL